MRGAWVLVVASACFHPSYDRPACGPGESCPSGLTCVAAVCEAAVDPDAGVGGIDAVVGSALDTCWQLVGASQQVRASACTSTIGPPIEIDGTVVIDTDSGVSTPAGFACLPFANAGSPICAIVASAITIKRGAKLSAHGTRVFALLAHAIDVQGELDVASHVGGPRGPGSTSMGCNADPLGVTKAGGGAGGGYTTGGGSGGDHGGEVSTGAGGGHTISIQSLRGGCDGGIGGDGSANGGPRSPGGFGGGAVWLSVDGTGILTIGPMALLNASGASGAGGAATNRGGAGGGSGGLIILQASTIARPVTTGFIFANGGHGGGGAFGANVGANGTDSIGPTSGGGDGAGGGTIPGSRGGTGGVGATVSMRTAGNGGDGDGEDTSPGGGGGGGGGGLGLIWATSPQQVGPSNVSPTTIAIP